MKFISSRKLSWMICGAGMLLAVVSFFFLPEKIPMHFSNGIADDFSSKIQFHWLIDGVLGILMIVEISVIYAPFA